MSTFTLIFDPGIEPSETGAAITATTYPGYSDPTNYNVSNYVKEFINNTELSTFTLHRRFSDGEPWIATSSLDGFEDFAGGSKRTESAADEDGANSPMGASGNEAFTAFHILIYGDMYIYVEKVYTVQCHEIINLLREMTKR